MTQDERLEHIKELQQKGFQKPPKNQLIILNNFYMLITIVVMSVVITIYVNYITPQKDEEKILKEKERQEYLQMRKRQIELSHQLNNKKDQNATTTNIK